MKPKLRISRKQIQPYKPVFIGEQKEEKISIQLFEYNKNDYQEQEDFKLDDWSDFEDKTKVSWLNMHGIHEEQLIVKACSKLQIHKLIIEDILDTGQRAKFQEFDNYWFFTMKSILPSDDANIHMEQISFILGDNYLLSFQEKKADYFSHIRERIRKNIGIVRERKSDYLLYLLVEAILDNYFKTAEEFENKIDRLNHFNTKSDPSPGLILKMEEYKREIQQIIKTLTPIREFVNKVERERFALIDKKHIKYYLELKDQCLQLSDAFDKMLSRIDSNINLFFSIQGHRMNQIMKTLTIVASIFIPLTFIAGIYGMNFKYMPELEWEWGYFSILSLMFMIIIALSLFFKRKNWF